MQTQSNQFHFGKFRRIDKLKCLHHITLFGLGAVYIYDNLYNFIQTIHFAMENAIQMRVENYNQFLTSTDRQQIRQNKNIEGAAAAAQEEKMIVILQKIDMRLFLLFFVLLLLSVLIFR